MNRENFCEFCGKSFSRRSSKFRHIRRIHFKHFGAKNVSGTFSSNVLTDDSAIFDALAVNRSKGVRNCDNKLGTKSTFDGDVCEINQLSGTTIENSLQSVKIVTETQAMENFYGQGFGISRNDQDSQTTQQHNSGEFEKELGKIKLPVTENAEMKNSSQNNRGFFVRERACSDRETAEVVFSNFDAFPIKPMTWSKKWSCKFCPETFFFKNIFQDHQRTCLNK